MVRDISTSNKTSVTTSTQSELFEASWCHTRLLDLIHLLHKCLDMGVPLGL